MVGPVELSEAAFRVYRKELLWDYAQDIGRAGVWSGEEAEDRAAREQLDGLLPMGTATEGHFLYAVWDDSIESTVGNLWLVVGDSSIGRSVWIYDILIHERFQRQGYGARTLSLLE
jgi:GNAT superfamily N-acetyltransferase